MAELDASVILPVYRVAPEYLITAIESILEVLRRNGRGELVTLDDCSPDQSRDILEDYAAKYPDLVRVFHNEKNLGIAESRQRLVQESRGRYILSFDQDDIMLPFDLTGVIELLDGEPNYCASYSLKYLFDENGLTGDVHGGQYSWFNAFFTPKMNINAMVIRKTDLLAHGSFRMVPGKRNAPDEDVYLMTRMAQDRDFHFDPVPRVLYRYHSAQKTQQADGKQQNERFFVHEIAMAHPKIYQPICFRRPVPVTPENFRVVMGLLGGAVFLNQDNYYFCRWCCDQAIAAKHDDYGAWEHLLLVLARFRREEEFQKKLAEARTLFPETDNFYNYVFTQVEFRNAMQYRRLTPELQKRCQRAVEARAVAPAIVTDNLPGKK